MLEISRFTIPICPHPSYCSNVFNNNDVGNSCYSNVCYSVSGRRLSVGLPSVSRIYPNIVRGRCLLLLFPLIKVNCTWTALCITAPYRLAEWRRGAASVERRMEGTHGYDCNKDSSLILGLTSTDSSAQSYILFFISTATFINQQCPLYWWRTSSPWPFLVNSFNIVTSHAGLGNFYYNTDGLRLVTGIFFHQTSLSTSIHQTLTTLLNVALSHNFSL